MPQKVLEDIEQLSAAMTTYTNKVNTNITITETEKSTSSNSDLTDVEKKEPTEVNPFSAVASAALLIQKAVRGRQGRIAFKQKMEGIPHTMVIGLETAVELQKNNDFLQSLPDTYILANLIRRRVMKSGRVREYCFSSHASKVVYQATSPVYAEDIKVTTTAVGTLVLTVMSQFMMGSDTFLGQVSVNIEDYKNLTNGGRFLFHNYYFLLISQSLFHS